MPVPTLIATPALDLSAELEDWGPRAGADSGSPRMSGRVFYRAGGIEVGVWECTPGGWTIENRSDHETVQILAGRAVMTDAQGGSVEVGPGDVLTLPRGWSGRWEILETLRKVFITVE